MHRISIYCINSICIFYAVYQKFDIYELFTTQRKRHPVRSVSCENIIRSFVNGGADVELARSRPANGAFAPSDFFMEVHKETFAVMAYYHYTLLTGVIQGLFRVSDKIS